MLDKSLLLRDGSTALSANELTPAGKYMGPDREPLTYTVYVPAAGGTSPTVDIKIQEADDNAGSPGTYRDVGVFKQITAVGEYHLTLKCDAEWRRYTATVGGTSPNFGNVVIGPEMGGLYESY